MARRKRPVEERPPVVSSDDEEEEEEEDDDDSERDEDERNDAVEEEKQEDDDGEEEEEGGGDDDGDEEEQEEEEKKTKSTLTATPSNNDSPPSDSDSESTQPSPSAYAVKPILPKPKNRDQKRPIANESTKRKLVPKDAHKDDGKKGCIQRLWSEADEVALLSGISRYKSEKGANPSSNMGAFHEFIKDSLQVDVSKVQLTDKISRLKKKYQNSVAKSENGQDPVFSNPHELKCFELAKKIWGAGVGVDAESKIVEKHVKASNPRRGGTGTADGAGGVTLALAKQGKGNELIVKSNEPNVKRQKTEKRIVTKEVNDEKVEGDVDVDVGVEELWKKHPCLSEWMEAVALPQGAKEILREKLGLIGKEKLKEFEGNWKKLKQAELELFVKKTELVNEQVKLVLDTIKSKES